MNTPLKDNPKLKKILTISIVSLVVLFLAYNFTIVGNIFNQVFLPNYAEEVAKPIEKALVEAGAVKVCESGDKGFGIDNSSPWYFSRFETKLNQEDTLKLLENISKENGFKNITSATNTAGTSYADNSIPNTNPRLEDGNIEFLYSSTIKKHFSPEVDSQRCTLSDGEKPEVTTFLLQVSLPSNKSLVAWLYELRSRIQ